jgi:hypothetical protein
MIDPRTLAVFNLPRAEIATRLDAAGLIRVI